MKQKRAFKYCRTIADIEADPRVYELDFLPDGKKTWPSAVLHLEWHHESCVAIYGSTVREICEYLNSNSPVKITSAALFNELHGSDYTTQAGKSIETDADLVRFFKENSSQEGASNG